MDKILPCSIALKIFRTVKAHTIIPFSLEVKVCDTPFYSDFLTSFLFEIINSVFGA